MTDSTPTDGLALAELMSPELARNPQPMYAMLRDGSPVLRVDGVGVVVTSRSGVDQILRDPGVFSSNMSAHDLKTERPLIPLQISIPFPSQVFLTLFGLPLEDLPTFLGMKDGVIRPDHVVGHEFGHPETEAHQQRTADAIYAYFERVLDERAGEEGDDLLSHLLRAEVDGERLTREDMLDICFLLLIAGLDTVSASLDCFFGHLAENPSARGTVVEQPDLIPSMVEEMLRWETPVMAVARVATRDAEVAGCPISTGEHVMAIIGAANVDDSEVPDAGAVRWDRDVNRHLAFGGGVHRCLGSHLARLELRVALREWHRRIPDYRIAPGSELVYTAGIRTLETFPMVLFRSA